MTEWAKKKYNDNYDYYMPWIEDKYLAWFGENKTSYTTKGTFLPSHSLPLLPIIPLFHHINLLPSPTRKPTLTLSSSSENLKKTEITGNKDIDKVQDSVAEGVGNQFGKGGLGGLGEGVGSTLSKQGFNRAEGEEQESDKKMKDAAGGAGLSNLGGMLGSGKK